MGLDGIANAETEAPPGVGRRGLELQRCAGRGMRNDQPAGVQRYPGGKRLAAAVLSVAHDRMAAMTQLQANLVLSPGL